MIRDVFIDVDYTLTDFEIGHQVGIIQLEQKYGKKFATEIDLWFKTILQGLRVKDEDWSQVYGGKEWFYRLRRELAITQGDASVNEWSREIACMWAAKSIGMHFTEHDAIEASNMYWGCVSDYSLIYDDATEFLNMLRERGIRYHIFTGSDARLRWDSKWIYDPVYASGMKAQRLIALRRQGIYPHSMTIGDPIDKPRAEFYISMFQNAEQACGAIDPQKCITVGDSYQGDVITPKTVCGFLRGYWIQRECQRVQLVEKGVHIIQRLTDIDLS